MQADPSPLSQEQTENFKSRGLLTFDPGISHTQIDRAAEATAAFWPRRPLFSAHHDANRIQDAWVHSTPVRRLALHPNVLASVAQLYARRPKPFQTLNFRVGTQQPAHSDTVHFNSEPFGALCGVWIALQDVHEDEGPLIYYPGSHNLPERNLPDFDLPYNFEHYPEYEKQLADWIQQQGLQAELGCVKKGQAIIWSANLLHGGAPQTNLEAKRLSQVTHYYFEGDRYWVPMFSEHGRHYYRPTWISESPARRSKIMARRLVTRIVSLRHH